MFLDVRQEIKDNKKRYANIFFGKQLLVIFFFVSNIFDRVVMSASN